MLRIRFSKNREIQSNTTRFLQIQCLFQGKTKERIYRLELTRKRMIFFLTVTSWAAGKQSNARVTRFLSRRWLMKTTSKSDRIPLGMRVPRFRRMEMHLLIKLLNSLDSSKIIRRFIFVNNLLICEYIQ